MSEGSNGRFALRSILAPLAVLAAATAYAQGCAPHGDPLEPVEPAPDPSPVVTPSSPEPATTTQPTPHDPPRVEPSPRATEFRARREPPKGAPKVASSIAFEIVAAGVAKPKAQDNNELDWFLGSSSPNPSWSPDGHRIAHYDGRCISVHDDSGKLVKSLRARGKNVECRGPRWSPNGRALVTSHTFHGPAAVFDLFGKGERIVGGTGSDPMVSGLDGLWSLSWHPGGEHLVGRVHQSGAVLVDAAKRGATVPLVTDEVPQMQGYFPSFAPGGRHFARVLGEWQGDAVLEVASFSLTGSAGVDVKDPWDTRQHKGRMAARAFVVPGPILEYVWSRDGERIAALRAKGWYPGYGNFDYGFGELLIIDVPSGETRIAALAAKNPTWSPDGKRIAFDSADGGIFVLDAAQPQLGAWPLHPTGVEPQWSPAGHAILALDPTKHQGLVLLLERP